MLLITSITIEQSHFFSSTQHIQYKNSHFNFIYKTFETLYTIKKKKPIIIITEFKLLFIQRKNRVGNVTIKLSK